MNSLNFMWKSGFISSLFLGLSIFCSAEQPDSLPTAEPPRIPYCSSVGEVFGANAFDHNFLLKREDDGQIETITFSKSTRFIRASENSKEAQPDTITPSSIHIGDRLCVQFSETDRKLASVILVLTRSDIVQQQLKVLSALHRDSAFGTIDALHTETHTIEMNRVSMDGSSQHITIDAKDPVLFRQYGENAELLSQATASSWEQLHIGDQIYVRGQRSADGSSMRAGLILRGGWRTFLGTIHSIDGLSETIRVQDIRTQKLFSVHVLPVALFRISPFLPDGVTGSATAHTQGQWTLHPLEFADLQNGDVVAVLGKINNASTETQALAVFTGFGSFHLIPQRPDAQILWLLDPLNLDVP